MEARTAVTWKCHAGFLTIAHLHHEVELQPHKLFEVGGGTLGSG